MTEKSIVSHDHLGRKCRDCKHFYGKDTRSSPPELAPGPQEKALPLLMCKGASA
jgi:hypothetical protein